MAVGRVDHHKVDPHFDQGRDAIHHIGRNPHGRPHAKPAVVVLAGVRVLSTFANVFEGNEPLQVPLIVHHRELFDLMLLKDLNRLVQGRADRNGHQILGGHHLPNWSIAVELKPYIPVRHDAHQLVGLVHHRNAPDGIVAHHIPGVGHRVVGRNRDRVQDHPIFRALDPPHLGGLVLDRHIFVEHPRAPLPRQRNGHVGLRDRVHGGREDRDIELDVSGQPRRGVRLTRHHGRVPRHKQDIVVGQAFRLNLVVGRGLGRAVRNRLWHG